MVKLDQETSLRQPVYVPALPRAVRRLGWRRRGEDGEGSSTESQADLRDVPPEVSGYVDHVVDSQYPEYVVIEASPRETGEEVTVVGIVTPLFTCVWCGLQVLPSPEVDVVGLGRGSSPLPPSQQPSPTPSPCPLHTPRHNLPIASTVFLDALMSSLSARTDDQRCLFTLCLLYALVQNKGSHFCLYCM